MSYSEPHWSPKYMRGLATNMSHCSHQNDESDSWGNPLKQSVKSMASPPRECMTWDCVIISREGRWREGPRVEGIKQGGVLRLRHNVTRLSLDLSILKVYSRRFRTRDTRIVTESGPILLTSVNKPMNFVNSKDDVFQFSYCADPTSEISHLGVLVVLLFKIHR